MDFVGGLYQQYLLSDVVIYSILDNLLGLESYTATNISVEAALKLINKLGSKIEEDTKKKKNEKKAEAEMKQKKIYDEF